MGMGVGGRKRSRLDVRAEAVQMLKPKVLELLQQGDLSFQLQVPGSYRPMEADHWAEAISERIVKNLESLAERTQQDVREAGDDGEKEEHARLDLALGMALMAGLETNHLIREGENDAFQRSGRTDVWKTWIHGQKRQPKQPRDNHVAMSGERVHCVIGEDNYFSNGARWPRDVEHCGPEEVIGCSCGLVYDVERRGIADSEVPQWFWQALGQG